MAMSRRLAGLGVVLVVAACGAQPTPPEKPPPPKPVAEQVPADLAGLVSAMDAVGLDLLTAPTLTDGPNLVVSPVSVSLALQLVLAGAGGAASISSPAIATR